MAKDYDVLMSFAKCLIDNGNGTFSLRTNGGSITPGTTVISGGTNQRVLFNDNGVVGEDAGFTYDKTTDSLTVGQLVAFQSGGPAYVYAFNTSLTKYIRTWADANFGYLDANTSIVMTAGTGNHIISLNDFIQTDIVSSGTTPSTGWIVQTANNGALNTGPMSMIQQNLGKDYTAALSNNGIFQDITGDNNTGVHINIASGASKSAGLIQGVHETNSVGQFIDLDGSSAYFQRLYQNVTGSQTIFQWNLNENYPTTDYTGTGSLSGTTFTGNVIELNNSQNDVFRLRYNGGAWAGENDPFFQTSDTMLSASHTITSIGTSGSDIIKIMSPNRAEITPSADTNSGLGITLYAVAGGSGLLTGVNDFNGGINLGNFTSGAISVIGSFGGVDNYSTGSVDGYTGIYYNALHGGTGSVVTYQYGAIIESDTDDSGSPGSPTGSVENAIGISVSVGAGGANITNAIAGRFIEPFVYNALNGYGASATITNKTAIRASGTVTIDSSDVATAASITNMTVATSFIRLTGSTATALHGIHADAYAKILTIYNVSSATVTLKHQSGTEGTAANRIICNTGADVAITTGKSAILQYDTNQSRWIHLLNS